MNRWMAMAIKSEWNPIWSVIMQPWIGGAVFLINGIRFLTEMNEKNSISLSISKHGAYETNGRRNSQISGDIFAALKQ